MRVTSHSQALCVQIGRHGAEGDVKGTEGKRAEESVHLLAGVHQGREHEQTTDSQHTSFWSLPMYRPCRILSFA